MKDRSKDDINSLGYPGGHTGKVRRFALGEKAKDAVIEMLSRAIQEVGCIRFSFLHGSFLQDTTFRDIDVAVYFDENMPDDEMQDLCTKLSVRLTVDASFPVDVNSLNHASLPFCYDATKGRALTWNNQEDLYQYREKIWIEYMDFYPLLQENLADLLE